MEIILTTGEDLLALRQATAPTIKPYKSSDRSAVSELKRTYKPDRDFNPFTRIQKNLRNGRLRIGAGEGIRTLDINLGKIFRFSLSPENLPYRRLIRYKTLLFYTQRRHHHIKHILLSKMSKSMISNIKNDE